MNKDYLPYFERLDEKYKQILMSWDKEKLIDHLVANIHNGEVLLERIDKAIEYIEEGRWSNVIGEEIQYSLHIPTLLNILRGEQND